MTRIISASPITSVAALCAFATLLGACSKKDSSTGPKTDFTVTADAATNAQTAPGGTAVAQPVAVHVKDKGGAVVPGAIVTWTVINGAGTTATATSTADATGTATVVWTLDTRARVDSMTASVQNGTSATITATGTPGPATAATIVSGDAQSVAHSSVSAPMFVKVADSYGNGISGVAVAWVVTGGGTLSAASSTTDATGKTQVTLTLGSTPGTYTVQATPAAMAAVTFHLTGT
jgi:predicted component of type VI protein secretion system